MEIAIPWRDIQSRFEFAVPDRRNAQDTETGNERRKVYKIPDPITSVRSLGAAQRSPALAVRSPTDSEDLGIWGSGNLCTRGFLTRHLFTLLQAAQTPLQASQSLLHMQIFA